MYTDRQTIGGAGRLCEGVLIAGRSPARARKSNATLTYGETTYRNGIIGRRQAERKLWRSAEEEVVMWGKSSTGSAVYRAGAHLFAVVGVFTALFAALGVLLAVQKGNWTFLVVVVVVTAVLFLLLQVLRLEVAPTGFRYRNLSGSRDVAFGDIGRAYLEVVRAKNAPQGVAAFWVERRDGGRVKLRAALADGRPLRRADAAGHRARPRTAAGRRGTGAGGLVRL